MEKGSRGLGSVLLPATLSKGTVWKLQCCHVCVPTKEIKNLPKTRSRFRKWFGQNPSPLTCSRGGLCGPQHIRSQLWEQIVTSPLRTWRLCHSPPEDWHGSKACHTCPGLEDRACEKMGGPCSNRMQKVICTNVLAPFLPPPPQNRRLGCLVVCVRYLKFGFHSDRIY